MSPIATDNQIPEISIVVPVYNEEGAIRGVLEKVIRAVQEMREECEIIVVNDRSADRTVEIVNEFVQSKKAILIDSKNSRGKGGALRTGFDLARGNYILMMDGDGSHQGNDIPRLIEELKRTKGLVIGSRIYGGSEEYTRIRAFGNIFLTWMFGMFHGRYLSDALNGFKAFNADIYRRFHYSSSGYEIEVELLVNALKLKLQITEVPSLELKRQAGQAKSKVVKDGFRFLWRIVFEYFRKRRYKHESARQPA